MTRLRRPRLLIGQVWVRPPKRKTGVPTYLRIVQPLHMGKLRVSFRFGSGAWGRPMITTALRIIQEYSLFSRSEVAR